jgi:hypothetical protein
MKDNDRFTKGEGKDGKIIHVCIRQPSQRILQEAQKIYNLEMARMIRSAASGGDRLLMKSELEEYMVKLGVWTKEDALQFIELQSQIRDFELILRKGGIKVSEGRTVALSMATARQQLFTLYAKRSRYDSITVESSAENHKFNFLVSKCVVDKESGLHIFENLDDYINNMHLPIAVESAQILAGMMFGYDNNAGNNVPEQIWLKEYGFVDDKGDLIDKQGRRIDAEGKLIDDQGRYINEKGELVDYDGELVDEYGNYNFKPQPFIDDETNKPVEEKPKKKMKKNKRKKTTKKK